MRNRMNNNKDLDPKIVEVLSKLSALTNCDEVNERTNIKESGIYMIYIDTDVVDNIVPIYIGRSQNIQRRYRVHLKNIMALNRIEWEEYYRMFFDVTVSPYDGQFLYCKIFKYMVDHKCTLNDFKMRVLCYCGEEELNEFELHYIKEFQSQFLGFNQFHAVSLRFDEAIRDLWTKELEYESKQLPYYLEHDLGFSQFNYDNHFPRRTRNRDEVLDNVLQELHEKYSISKGYNEKIRKIEEERQEFKECEEKLRELIYRYRGVNRFPKASAGDYLKGVVKVISNYDRLLGYDKDRVKKINDLKVRKNQRLYGMIFPKNYYSPFPLEHREVSYCNDVEKFLDGKTIFLEFFVSPSRQYNFGDLLNRGITLLEGDSCNLLHLKITFLDNSLNREEFIYTFKTSLTEYLDDETVRYVEKSMYFKSKYRLSFRENMFKPVLKINDYSIVSGDIDLNTESFCGINPYFIKEQEKIYFIDVWKKLNNLIDDETKIVVTSNVGNSKLEEAIKYSINYDDRFDYEDQKKLLNEPDLSKFMDKIGRSKSKFIIIQQGKSFVKNKPLKKSKPIKKRISKKVEMSDEEQREFEIRKEELKKLNYIDKVKTLVDYIDVIDYINSYNPAKYRCQKCGYEWEARSDKIYARPYCRSCKFGKK